MTHTRRALACSAAALLAAAGTGWSWQAEPTDELVALTYHKLADVPLDYTAAAQYSPTVAGASSFDRPDAVQAEAARLQGLVAGATAAREFTMRINDYVSDYDHQTGEFSIRLFEPGSYVPIQAFRQSYSLVFANAASARAISMPKAEARDFDGQLAAHGRSFTNEVRFRVVGSGDPAGAVTGAHVIRAELLASRLLDRDDRVFYTPTVTPSVIAASGEATGRAGTASAAFDAASADVAGFRVGVKAKELEATLQRLFGPATRRAAGADAYPGIATVLTVNELGCVTLPGRRTEVKPGAVCVTALLDGDDVVRSVRIERVFPWLDPDVFRRTLVARYGPVADAQQAGNFSLAWGPDIAPALGYSRAGPLHALTAVYEDDDDFLRRSGNALPRIRVVLQLVDATWAAANGS